MLLSGPSCTDVGVADGEHSYVVAAVFRSWTSTSSTSSLVTVANATQIVFTTQSSDTTTDTVINPPIVVRLWSAAGTPVQRAGVPVTLDGSQRGRWRVVRHDHRHYGFELSRDLRRPLG